MKIAQGGPAFIPWVFDLDKGEWLHKLIKFDSPRFYVWQNETEGTMAGWVRKRKVGVSALMHAA
jgi:hypothetical protein